MHTVAEELSPNPMFAYVILELDRIGLGAT